MAFKILAHGFALGLSTVEPSGADKVSF